MAWSFFWAAAEWTPIPANIVIMSTMKWHVVLRIRGSLLGRAAVAGIVLAAMTAQCLAAGPAGGKRIIGYFAEWSRRYTVGDIPADKLTHINYAFAVIRDGECTLKDNLAADRHFPLLRKLKQDHPHLKTLVSIGGWTDSGPFSDMAMTAESRERFARSCADFAKKHGFDGIDIDWEYPGGGGMDKGKGRPEDTRNFTLLLQELRKQLDAQEKADGDKHYLLTIAAPAGGQAKRIELDQIHRSLDFINLMTYDFAGYWNERTSFNAPLYSWGEANEKQNADASVRAYLDAGVPKDKLVLGVPFYGRAFGGVKSVNNGLDQKHSGKAPRIPGTGENWSYRSIVTHCLGKGPTRHWQDQAKVPWLYDAAKGLFVSYDDPESLKLKAEYVRDKDLGGVMIWELSDDDEKSSLLDALTIGLQKP